MNASSPTRETAGTPEVSVVMSTVAVDDFLLTAVGSVLSQEDVDLELVLVLDGAVCAPGSLPADPRLRVLPFPERRGLTRALNSAVAVARADVVARLDADDLALPGRLRAQLDEMALRPGLAVLGTSVVVIDHDGDQVGVLDASTGAGLARRLLRHNVIAHPSCVFRRSVFEAVGGYDPACTRMQDYELWCRMAARGEIDNLAAPLTAYRSHPGQISRSTPPWGPAARRVLRARRRLARHLGRPRLMQHVEDAAWSVAQALRHAGLRRPAYETRARPRASAAEGAAAPQ